jgi:uncharacterized protein (DUF3084 family)
MIGAAHSTALKSMDRTLREHISELEQRIRDLNTKSMENQLTQTERNRVESELRVAQQALNFYREGLELELLLKR